MELPNDHKAVYRNITKYSIVNRHECYQKLGYIETNNINGKPKTTLSNKIPMQLCNPKEFREKIAPSLIRKNPENKGIPQGSPISDVLANLYLLNFDKKMTELATRLNGFYRRYSDDILLILPCQQEEIEGVICLIKNQIVEEHLNINESKTNITEFFYYENQLTCKPYHSETIEKTSKSKKPFEYLGFSFDGKNALIRSKTLSGYYRNMTVGIRQITKNAIKRYPHESPQKIFIRTLPILCKQYGKIQNYSGKKNNFWSYAHRSKKIMGSIGGGIPYQLRKKNKKIEEFFIQNIKAKSCGRKNKSQPQRS